MRDYADACFRYLRATGLVNVSHVGKSLSIVPERIEDVDIYCRRSIVIHVLLIAKKNYIEYLGNAAVPQITYR